MWFRKEKKAQPSPVKDATARFVAGGIIRFQLRVTALLKRLEARCSPFQKKALLVVFCLVSGNYCLYVLADAIFRNDHRTSHPAITLPGRIPPVANPPPLFYKQDTSRVRHHGEQASDTVSKKSSSNKQ